MTRTSLRVRALAKFQELIFLALSQIPHRNNPALNPRTSFDDAMQASQVLSFLKALLI